MFELVPDKVIKFSFIYNNEVLFLRCSLCASSGAQPHDPVGKPPWQGLKETQDQVQQPPRTLTVA